MKRELILLLILGLVIIISSCSTRKDRVFSAFDELHYVILYEKGNEFEMLYNGINTVEGKYTLVSDTILLDYDEIKFKEFNPNKKLTRKILIDRKSKRVNSLDSRMRFCADIGLDKINKN